MKQRGEIGVHWLDEEHPFEEEISAAQIAGALRVLDPPCKRIADLGCGAGRLLVPLARAGNEVTGVDRDAGALQRCRDRLDAAEADATLADLDFLDPDSWSAGALAASAPFDAILCTGNTFMTVAEVEHALDLLGAVKRGLARGGVFLVDDFCAGFWPELAEGNWQSGISEDGDLQLVWHPTDSVFALRRGGEVDAECWAIQPGDRRFRLWTDGQLAFAAKAAGLSGPVRLSGAHLLALRAGEA